MDEFKFGCVDLISSVDCFNEENITGNGFQDSAIFSSVNKLYFNTESIIDFLNKNKINKVISSFGKGTSLNKKAKIELERIIIACPKTDFKLFDLPAFGRPMMSTYNFGSMVFEDIVNN